MMPVPRTISLLSRICCFTILLSLALLPAYPALAQSLPDTFGKSQPGDGAQDQPFALLLTWDLESSTARYEYCIDTVDNDACDTAWTSTGSATSAHITLAANNTYYWQVRAAEGSDTVAADAGAWWSFGTVHPRKSSTGQLKSANINNLAEVIWWPSTNLVKDPSFEAGSPNPYWDEADSEFGTPLCNSTSCLWEKAFPNSGGHWAWFGGSTAPVHTGSLSQDVVFPSCGGARLQFYFWIGYSEGGGADDQFFAKIDNQTVFSVNATQIGSYSSYKFVSLNVSQFANGGTHKIEFSSINRNHDVGYNLDDIALIGCPVISGYMDAAGVTMNYTGGSTMSDGSGFYSFEVPFNWTGTVTPAKPGYIFSPTSRSYTNVIYDQTYQNYVATPPFMTIYGNTRVGGVTLHYLDGSWKSVTSQANGNYSITVPRGWSGTVTPVKANYTFTPVNRAYSNVITNQLGQDYVSSLVQRTISGNVGSAGVELEGAPMATYSQADGSYSLQVPHGWSGTITPRKTSYTFSPVSRTYTNVSSNLTGQNYTATQLYTIRGYAYKEGIIFSYIDGVPKTVVSEPGGSYSITVPAGWSGTVTPSKSGYRFSPVNRTYTNLSFNLWGEDFIPIPLYAISGNTGVGGVTLSYTDETTKTVTSQADGSYSLLVPEGWSGTVTPSHDCFTFDAVDLSYEGITGNLTSQDYTPTFNSSAGCADVDVSIGGTNQGRFGLSTGASTRASFVGMNNGPVKITSTNNLPIIGAERLIYKVNNVNTSYSELLGLPDSQLDTIYWLPWYNNKDFDAQLRFANVSDATATVHVFIGGTEMTPVDGLKLLVGESTRISYNGVNNGPVKIVSDVPIVAAERLIYKVNGVNTSYSELMALPNSQLDTTYWLPWYNNKDFDAQLRFANVSDSTATIHVYIGGVEMGTGFTLEPGASTRQSFAGINNGPVRIESNVNIVAAERLIFKVNGVNTSYSELMALPNKQLDTTYWLPWYNNKDFDTQLRFANVSDSTATVHVYIGGVEMGTGFTLEPGASTRQSFAGVNNGSVKIISDQNIVAAERLVYKVNGVNTSYSELMALPTSQLDTTYWLPWYNNKDFDTQLRFGTP